MSLSYWQDPHGTEAVHGPCTCNERHCERHEEHRCQFCAEMHHVDAIAEPWARQWWCPACIAKVWECDEWADSDANRAELDRVGFVVPDIAAAAE